MGGTPLLYKVTHGGSYPAGGYGAEDDDFSGAAEHASRHAGDSGDSSLFSTLLGALTQKKQSLADQDVDEDGKWHPLPRAPTARWLTSAMP